MGSSSAIKYLNFFRFGIASPIAAIVLAATACSNIQRAGHDLKNYYVVNHNSWIEARIVSSSLNMNPIIGVIEFEYSGKFGPEKCLVRTVIGNQSNYLNYKAGSIISVVPTNGCKSPAIATNMRFPVFDIALCLFMTISVLLMIAKTLKFFAGEIRQKLNDEISTDCESKAPL